MEKPSISQRAKNAPPSPVRKLLPLADRTKKRGIKIYHINIGDPDFEVPEKILHTFKDLARTTKRIPYASSKGLKSTIQAWQKYYSCLGINLTENEILITAGAGEALVIVSAIVADPGDELIVFEPFYANYAAFANQASAKLVPVSLDKKNNYHLPNRLDIISKITPRTRAIYFTNPNNPTGTVFTKEEVQTVVQIAKEYNLFLVSDEAYNGMSFDGKKCVSALHVATKAEKQNIIIVDSVSKKLNVCGARIGAIISKNQSVCDAAFRFAQGRLSVASLEQQMVIPMLTDCLGYISWLTKEYQKRRDAFIISLEKELGIYINRPEGAFYTMVKLPVDDTEKFAKWLLTDFQDKNETVMVAPGAGFYATKGLGLDEIRVAYVLNEKDLARAAQLLGLAVKRYNSTKK
ncbi:pyridoxal phosphate-dependent aminotransferase [Patescibacteria group bacterium]|nr:pyridoxal phosphate-dependent aminotransferase [Patescibacteria group bacterium]